MPHNVCLPISNLHTWKTFWNCPYCKLNSKWITDRSNVWSICLPQFFFRDNLNKLHSFFPPLHMIFLSFHSFLLLSSKPFPPSLRDERRAPPPYTSITEGWRTQKPPFKLPTRSPRRALPAWHNWALGISLTLSPDFSNSAIALLCSALLPLLFKSPSSSRVLFSPPLHSFCLGSLQNGMTFSLIRQTSPPPFHLHRLYASQLDRRTGAVHADWTAFEPIGARAGSSWATRERAPRAEAKVAMTAANTMPNSVSDRRPTADTTSMPTVLHFSSGHLYPITAYFSQSFRSIFWPKSSNCDGDLPHLHSSYLSLFNIFR